MYNVADYGFFFINCISYLQKTVKPVLTSRSVLLGELQENHFVSVVCGKGPLSKNCYVLTRSGQLCLFDDKRRLDRFTEVKVNENKIIAT